MQRPTATAPLIRLEDVRLTLKSAAGDVNILRGISLDVGKGEAVGLVGPSGSGKSTLLMVLAGLERPSSGRIAIDGRELTAMGEDALAAFRRDNIGIVFQSFHLVPTMTALENVAIPLELAGIADAFERARGDLDAVGLSHRVDHYPGQLSGGEQQRVALARAVTARPKILLADEPTGNLDGATGKAIVELLFDILPRTGATLILITHDETLAQRCDRVFRLADGLVDRIETGARVRQPRAAGA